MKKVLIHENKELFENIKKDLNAFNPLLVKMQQDYEGLEIGTFTNKVMQLLKDKGTNPIEVEFYEYISAQLEASGVTSNRIRQNMIKGSEPLFIEFKTAFQNVKDFVPPQFGLNLRSTLDFNLISFEEKNGLFVINKKSQDEILEMYCRVYLENQKEKSIYDSLQNFVKAQKEVKTSLLDADYKFNRIGYELQEILEVFLSPDFSINPNSISYGVNQKEQRERFRGLTTKI